MKEWIKDILLAMWVGTMAWFLVAALLNKRKK